MKSRIKKKRYEWIAYIAVIVIITIAVVLNGKFLKPKTHQPSGIEIKKEDYPITGIDVSAHTGKKQDIDFVFIKATEGAYFVDDNFEVNYKNAKLNNIPVGVYHFFSFNVNGKEQANHFYVNIIGKTPSLPYVLDVEEWANQYDISTKKVIAEIRSFITVLNSKGSHKIILYSNESSYEKYLKDHFDDHEIWICSFKEKPDLDRKWTFWQYSHKGKLDGAKGLVDLNVFNGNRSKWEQMIEMK
jgi:lysozyme